MATYQIPGVGTFALPDDTPPAEVPMKLLAIKQAHTKPAESAPAQASGSFVDPLIGQGLLMGAGDEIRAGVRAGARRMFGSSGESLGQLYANELKDSRAKLDDYRQKHPYLAPALEIGGSAAGLMLAPEALAVKGATTAARLGNAAMKGAGIGATTGFASGEGGLGNRLGSAAEGAAVGGVAGAVGQGIANKIATSAAKKAAPSLDALKQAADDNYSHARAIGMEVKPGVYDRIATDIASKAQRSGIDPTLHPKATAAVKRIVDAKGNPMSLQELENLRQIVGDAAGSSDGAERRVASIVKSNFDDHMAGLKARDVNSGDPQAVHGILTKARSLVSREKKGEIVNNAIELAKLSTESQSQSGMDNALRIQFKQLSAKMIKDKRLRNTFTAAEREAIRRVAVGGPMQGILRLAGKMSPRGVMANSSNALTGIGAGAYTGNPMIGAATYLGMMGVGAAGHAASTAIRQGNADLASALVRSGGTLPLAAMSPAQRAAFAMSSGIGAEGRGMLDQPNPLVDSVFPSLTGNVR